MRVRGGHPQLPPASLKTAQPEAQAPKKLLQKALDGVLKAGQSIVLPGRTGLSQLADHFDARQKPDYDKLLKGETPQAAAQAKAQEVSPQALAASQAATAFAAESALALMDLLPQPQMRDVEEEEELEREDSHENPPPEVEPTSIRNVELQCGLFTLEDGSIDIGNRRLGTIEALVDGDVDFVSCAVDFHAIPEGSELRIPALDAAIGKPIRLRAVHQNARTEGVGSAYLEVCVSDPERWRAILERVIAVEIRE